MKKILIFLSITLFSSFLFPKNLISCQVGKIAQAEINDQILENCWTNGTVFNSWTDSKFIAILIRAEHQLVSLYNENYSIKKAIKNNLASKLKDNTFEDKNIVKISKSNDNNFLNKQELNTDFPISNFTLYLHLNLKKNNSWFEFTKDFKGTATIPITIKNK